jgi:hypothetical protein
MEGTARILAQLIGLQQLRALGAGMTFRGHDQAPVLIVFALMV